MTTIWTKNFWLDTLERAIRTGAQVLLLAWGADQFFNAFELDWVNGAGVFAGGMVLAVLTALAASPLGTGGTASIGSGIEYS